MASMFTGNYGLFKPPPQGGAQLNLPQVQQNQQQQWGGAQLNMPPPPQYQAPQPYRASGGGTGGRTRHGTGLGSNLGLMSQYAKGLMDPTSDYYQRLSQAMQRQIGQQTGAQKRSAALAAAQSGLGAGASPERMQMVADISRGGLEAQGLAEAGLALQAPQLGMQGLQSTFSPYLGIERLGEQSRQFGAQMGAQQSQFGAGLAEQQRQYGGNLALQQQQMAAQQALQQAQLQQQQQQQLMQQYAMMFGLL